MKYKIELGYLPFVKIPEIDGAIVLPNASVELEFFSKHYANLTLKVFCRLNGRVQIFNAKSAETINITPMLQAGVLEIVVDHIIKGKVAKRWELQPITLIEDTPNFVLKDYMSSLEQRIEALEKKHETIL